LRIQLMSLALVLSTSAAVAECSAGSVELRGDWGKARFSVELADTPDERSRGLMFVEEMPRSSGMLFVYERPQRAVFWMKNTLIPLDMIFADRTGRVVHVHHGAIPGDLTGIDGGDDVFAVLEINGGLAKRMGIVAGSDMRHGVFEDGPAAWPC
jgi:uncharacterized membrane protein (UPF0127 family)